MVDCVDDAHGHDWSAYQGDTGSILPQLPSGIVDFSIYSIPFLNLFTYSPSEADLGNCQNEAEFFEQYGYIVREKLRLTKPGRITAVHCSDLPSRKWSDGFIGTKPFSDQVTDAHQAAGWQFLRRVTIWRDPVVEMTRTKALNLLHKQILKDSTCSWPGNPDYLMIYRAPGSNQVPVGHKPHNFPVEMWQKWASPCWMDINQTDTLNNKATASRWIGDAVDLDKVADADDERHLCPLQMHLIERAQIMWSNPGDVVLSPFMGIGSEGVVAMRRSRKFIGIELKESYFSNSVRNLKASKGMVNDLFGVNIAS